VSWVAGHVGNGSIERWSTGLWTYDKSWMVHCHPLIRQLSVNTIESSYPVVKVRCIGRSLISVHRLTWYRSCWRHCLADRRLIHKLSDYKVDKCADNDNANDTTHNGDAYNHRRCTQHQRPERKPTRSCHGSRNNLWVSDQECDVIDHRPKI